MNYNQFIESKSGLKDALFNLFNLDVDEHVLELKDVEVTQPKLTYNECMVLQESYSYDVKFITHFVSGPETGREFEATVSIPKMCERGFLIKGLQDNHLKWRAPVNFGEVRPIIGCRGTIPSKFLFINKVCSIYLFKTGRDYIPRLELNSYSENSTTIKKCNLEKYLLNAGYLDITDILGGPFKTPKDYEDLTEAPEIPVEILQRLNDKFYQLTGMESDIDPNNPKLTPKFVYELVKTCIDHPENFDVFTPVDVEFNSFHTMLFTHDIYKYKMIKYGLSGYLTKHRALDQSLLQKAIYSTFNMLGSENAVQAGALSNAVSFISQTNKLYFRDGYKYRKYLRYTDDFYGVVCPCKTPESVGLCGIKNEFASSVRVDNDKVLISVLTPSGEYKELTYMEYFKSKILLSDSYDYVNNVTIPNKYGKLKIIHKGKFNSVKNDIKEIDYIMCNAESGMSYNAGLIPFLNRCDGTRLSMATSMTDQCIPIVGGRRSIVTTKLSSSIYQKSDLNWKSDVDGIVEQIYKGYIKIKDDEGKEHIYSMPDSITSSTHSCNLFNPAVKVGDRVKKGDVLMESNSFKDKHLALTVPLKVAFLNYSSKSDEDAFVISDRAAELLAHKVNKEIVIDIPSGKNFVFDKDRILRKVEIIQDNKKLTSDGVAQESKGLNKFGLPKIGSTYRTGELLAIGLCEPDEENPKYELAKISEVQGEDLLDYYDPLFLPVPYGIDLCKIESVEVYYKSELKDDPSLKEFFEYYDNIRESEMKDLTEKLGTTEILKKTYDLKSKYDPDLKIIIKISAINPMKIGDKISNRYGGKGTISAIIPYDEMPRINGENGERVDICVPIKSVVNRKNFSQAYEGNLADLSKLAWKMNCTYIDNKEFDMVRDVLNHLYLTDKFSKFTDEELIKFHRKQDDYYTIEVDAIDMKYTNQAFIELNKYFDYNTSGSPVYVLKEDDYGPRWVRQSEDVTHGTIEFERLHFMPEDKAKATSALGYHDDLVMKVGHSREGGQRIGQMEVWALISYDTLQEFHQLKNIAGEIESSDDFTPNSVTTQMLLIGLLQHNKSRG